MSCQLTVMRELRVFCFQIGRKMRIWWRRRSWAIFFWPELQVFWEFMCWKHFWIRMRVRSMRLCAGAGIRRRKNGWWICWCIILTIRLRSCLESGLSVLRAILRMRSRWSRLAAVRLGRWLTARRAWNIFQRMIRWSGLMWTAFAIWLRCAAG